MSSVRPQAGGSYGDQSAGSGWLDSIEDSRNGDVPPFDIPFDIELTEDGVARAFSEMLSGKALYDGERKDWYLWAGDHWQRDRTDRTIYIIRQICRQFSHVCSVGEQRRYRGTGFIYGVERLARSDPELAVTPEQWDQDPMLLGCPDATVALKTGEILSPAARNLITRRTAVAPGDGHCPGWIRFLMEATGQDEDVVRLLQVWCGYLLTGLTSEHTLLFIYGPGGNGKSVFLNIVVRILGDYAKTAAMDTFVASKGDRHPTELAMLSGARLVAAAETEEGRRWAESRIKSVTGGDPITARFMRGDFFTYKPTYKLMLVGNHQPVLRSVDDAIRRRLLVLPFECKPTHPNPDLEDALWAEAPQILTWMILGCLEWQEEGLPRPQKVDRASEDYFQEQDLFGAWIKECCTLGGQDQFTAAADLFFNYKTFAEAAGEAPGTQKALGGKLSVLGLKKSSKRFGKKTERGWLGISLN